MINVKKYKEERWTELEDEGTGIQEKKKELIIDERKSTSPESFSQEAKRSHVASEENRSIERALCLKEEISQSVTTSTEKIGNNSGKSYADKEKDIEGGTKNSSVERKRSLTSVSSSDVNSLHTTLRKTYSFSSLGNQGLLSPDKKVYNNKTLLESNGPLPSLNALVPRTESSPKPPPTRTTVVAQLIHRKLRPRQSQSIAPEDNVRESKVFKDQETGILNIPSTMEQFNKYRSHLEMAKLNTVVKTEVF